MVSDDVREAVHETCRRARTASRALARATSAEKDAALHSIADALESAADRIAAANAGDLERGRAEGMSPGLLDRLCLDAPRVSSVADAVRVVASLDDPVGEVVRGQTLPNGLRLRQVRVPMGVVAMVYEARPNVTVDAAVLALKSGNAAVLRGGSAALGTNAALVRVMREALAGVGLPADLVASIDEHGREGVTAPDACPRAGRRTDPSRGSRADPGHGRRRHRPGDRDGHRQLPRLRRRQSAPSEVARAIVLNSKTHRVGVCNAAETLLVHAGAHPGLLGDLLEDLHAAGVVLHVDERAAAAAQERGVLAEPATDEDWGTEYLAPEMAVAVVDDLDVALEHIRRWSSGHTEAIVTTDLVAAERFGTEVDSAAVMVNASTRFTDGGQLGLGAEIGISTQKLHARGPMGLAELTTTRWVVHGDGHVRD